MASIYASVLRSDARVNPFLATRINILCALHPLTMEGGFFLP